MHLCNQLCNGQSNWGQAVPKWGPICLYILSFVDINGKDIICFTCGYSPAIDRVSIKRRNLDKIEQFIWAL